MRILQNSTRPVEQNRKSLFFQQECGEGLVGCDKLAKHKVTSSERLKGERRHTRIRYAFRCCSGRILVCRRSPDTLSTILAELWRACHTLQEMRPVCLVAAGGGAAPLREASFSEKISRRGAEHAEAGER